MNYFLRQKEGLCPSVAYQNVSKKEDQAMNFIPVHPAQNLHLSDGVYVAEIRDVEERVYKVDSRLIHLLMWLPAEQVHLCTHFYFPHGYSIKSQQRLWHLCHLR